MDEFRWFKFALLLFTVGLDLASEQESFRIYIREGDEATLPCKHVGKYQNNCDKIKWLFADSENRKEAVSLTEGGQIGVNAKNYSERLKVLKNCSLVIKKVSTNDSGLYSCRQEGSQDTHVHLFLITMSEQKNDENVTLHCSVRPCREEEHSLKWLFEDEVAEDKDDDDNKGIETPSSSWCSASVTFPSSDAQQKPKYLEAFKCEMDDLRTEQVHNFTFKLQSSDEEATRATTAATTAITPLTRRTTENSNKITTNPIEPIMTEWLLYAVVAAGLLALIMIIVTIIVCKRTKGKKAEKDENTGQRLSPVVSESAPHTSHDTADPEDGVSYASISYIKKDKKARVQVKYDDEDEGDSVTYSTVKVSSSSAGASDEPSSLYASVERQAK